MILLVQHELRALRQTREALEDQLERVSRHSGNGSQANGHNPPSRVALEEERKKASSNPTADSTKAFLKAELFSPVSKDAHSATTPNDLGFKEAGVQGQAYHLQQLFL